MTDDGLIADFNGEDAAVIRAGAIQVFRGCTTIVIEIDGGT